MDKYNGTQGSNTKRETWVFTATHVEVASEDSGMPGVVQRYSGDYTVSGNMLTLNISCPAGLGSLKTLFTSADGKLSTGADPNTTDMEIHTYTKQ
jgi:hypothetical protein